MREKIVSFLALFGSSATLFCCALPALLAMIGLAIIGVGRTRFARSG